MEGVVGSGWVKTRVIHLNSSKPLVVPPVCGNSVAESTDKRGITSFQSASAFSPKRKKNLSICGSRFSIVVAMAMTVPMASSLKTPSS